ncbi:MAG: hypothetical protein JWN04_4077, partial [Myxococcaceae bacterium]|nr:hypothetical protein [Myxococcaceae bacterium]
GEPLLLTGRDAGACDPSQPGAINGACAAPGAYVQGAGDPPNSKYSPISQGTSVVAPKLKAPSTDEFVLGGDYEILRDGRLGIMYAKRWLTNTVDDMSTDDAKTFFFGNPGHGIAKSVPKAVRKYDGITLSFTKAYSQGWMLQASYTLSWLRGNYGGLFNPDSGQFDPHMNSSFDISQLITNTKGPLPGDNRHYVKFFAAKDVDLPGKWGFVTPGVSFRAYSGGPTNYLGAHPIYQQESVYILPAGSGARLPWVASADLRLAYGYRFTKTRSISATVDIFNLFNFQSGIARDQRYTATAVNPITSGGITQLTNYDGTPFDPTNKNANFGHLSAYQPPRVFRFGLKGTF